MHVLVESEYVNTYVNGTVDTKRICHKAPLHALKYEYLISTTTYETSNYQQPTINP